MTTLTKSTTGAQALGELQEFAGFPAETQRLIRLALQARFGCPETLLEGAVSVEEACSLRARIAFYAKLEAIKEAIPVDDDISSVTTLLCWLVPLTVFDIAHRDLNSFSAYRFLYERLLGAAVRPWLLGAFCTAAAHPQLHPEHRRQLLQSINAGNCGAQGWSIREAVFHPQTIDADEASDA